MGSGGRNTQTRLCRVARLKIANVGRIAPGNQRLWQAGLQGNPRCADDHVCSMVAREDRLWTNYSYCLRYNQRWQPGGSMH